MKTFKSSSMFHRFQCSFLIFILLIPLIIQAAEVDFTANPWYGPRPLVVTFTDQSDYNASFDRIWSFPGGTPSSGTGSSVVVTYYTAGTYDVTLEIWAGGVNGKKADEKTKPNYIHVYELIDYGDAPDLTVSIYEYPTQHVDDGASHIINNLYLGSEIDSELDGQPSLGADLDDNTDDHDEDGVDIGDLTAGITNEITVVAHNAGLLDCWVDWGQDGTWIETGDHAIVTESLINGTNTVDLPVPAHAVPGYTYARFRYSSQGTNYNGQVFNGEVEDYLVNVLADMDWGDAKEGYPVTLAENGARHQVSTFYYLGEIFTDSEEDGVHSPNASWDNDNGDNDELGVAFSLLNIGAPASVSTMAHGCGFLNVWIDFNQNDDWSDPGDHVIHGEIMADGLNSKPFDVPADALPGMTFARVRYCADQGIGPTGPGGHGEVEDHQVEILQQYDFGDAPDTFPTTGDDGAAHILSQMIYLGDNMPDDEETGQPNPAAMGDDSDGYDDEDGVPTLMIPPSGTAEIPVEVNGRGYLHAWIDLDHSGTWEADEKFIDGVALSSCVYPAELTMPPGTTPGHAFVRFRYCLDMSIGPDGIGQAGEVEDYRFTIGLPDTFDYGDAPEPYGDPRHPINAETYLGGSPPDPETEPAYSEHADGDDLIDGHDDEDGVSFPELFIPGSTSNVECHMNGPGHLYYFFDWNQDFDFTGPGEAFSTYVAVVGPAAVTLPISVPPDALPGDTYARFRYEYPVGPADWGPWADPPSPTAEGDPGEVEDYQISVTPRFQILGEDYGDAPAVFDAGGAAFHTISPDIFIGGMVDSEDAPYSSPDAEGDDIHDNDDEEPFIDRYLSPGSPYSIDVDVHVEEGITGYMHAWIDFNYNNDWNDPGEKVVNGEAVLSTDDFYHKLMYIPLDVELGWTFARIRFCTDESIGPNGPGGDGEVMDRQIRISKDFGDAPGEYLPSEAIPASHSVDTYFEHWSLGENLDTEFGPFFSLNADGDDLNGDDDDEDGIMLGILEEGTPATGNAVVTRYCGSPEGMYLNGWIDFNQDKDWTDLGEHVITDQHVDHGDNPLAINVPWGVPSGGTCARFRLSDEPGVGTHGFGGVGEVEDHLVFVHPYDTDFGDAPDDMPEGDYPTRYMSVGGAWHEIVEGFHLGEDVDEEPEGHAHPQAEGDNFDDGVVFDSDFIPGEDYHFTITLSAEGYVNAWADYNGNGNWDDIDEQILVNGLLTEPEHHFTRSLPAWTCTDKIYFRFRLSEEALILNQYWGGGGAGEVEDYLIDLSAGAPLGLKWSQPPLFSVQSFYDSTYWGWDEKSVYGDTLLADNWFCGDARPVKMIRWWGSYADWDSLVPPPDSPDSFHVAIWSDDPIDPIRSQSRPGEVIWEKFVSRSETGETVDGQDFYPGITVTPDSVFRYEVKLSIAEQFEQQEDSTYFWLSVAAIYDRETPEEHVWGWTTRESYLISDAVQIMLPNEPVLGSEYEEGNTLKSGWDCAFELLTDLGELPFDFGDAPDTDYPTSLASNGAHHYIWTGTGLGVNLDKEPDSYGDTDFTWDDLNHSDDEDGITFHDTLYDAGDIAFLTVNAAAYGVLNAWADYNGDGDWLDFGERVFIDMPCYTGNNNLAFNIPASTSTKTVGMRFRIAPVAGLRPTGIAIGGEVEDMAIQMDQIATAVEESKTKSDIPDEFRLMHNYPNPFNPSTTIPFHLPEMAEVKITIYDILGRHVRTLVHGEWSPGSHEIRWDGITDQGHRAATGIYIYQIECSGLHGQQRFVESHKMLLLK